MNTFQHVVAGRYNMQSDDPAIPMIIQKYTTHLVKEYTAQHTPAVGDETVVLLEEARDHADGVVQSPTAQDIIDFEAWLEKAAKLQVR